MFYTILYNIEYGIKVERWKGDIHFVHVLKVERLFDSQDVRWGVVANQRGGDVFDSQYVRNKVSDIVCCDIKLWMPYQIRRSYGNWGWLIEYLITRYGLCKKGELQFAPTDDAIDQ